MWHEFTQVDWNQPITIDLTKVVSYKKQLYWNSDSRQIETTVVHLANMEWLLNIEISYEEFKTIMQGVKNV
jgi:outer membrane usher protein FimD/PapC